MATLYHAPNARSLRVLWTLEELGAKADVKTLPFPPREKEPDYLKVNPTGAIPAMVFVAVFMMPFYYGSKARSVPEYLKMRFDEKTRALNA